MPSEIHGTSHLFSDNPIFHVNYAMGGDSVEYVWVPRSDARGKKSPTALVRCSVCSRIHRKNRYFKWHAGGACQGEHYDLEESVPEWLVDMLPGTDRQNGLQGAQVLEPEDDLNGLMPVHARNDCTDGARDVLLGGSTNSGDAADDPGCISDGPDSDDDSQSGSGAVHIGHWDTPCREGSPVSIRDLVCALMHIFTAHRVPRSAAEALLGIIAWCLQGAPAFPRTMKSARKVLGQDGVNQHTACLAGCTSFPKPAAGWQGLAGMACPQCNTTYVKHEGDRCMPQKVFAIP